MQETQEQIVAYELAERHPARLHHLTPVGERLYYTCFFCGVECDPDTRVENLDVSNHSPDCVWRKARVAWQTRLAAELQQEQTELTLLNKVLAECGCDPCTHCQRIRKFVIATGLGEGLL
jgi:hypothetical protein